VVVKRAAAFELSCWCSRPPGSSVWIAAASICLRADQERAAFGEAARADGVAQVDRSEAAGAERFVVGDTPNPEDFGRGLDELELVDVAIDVLAEVFEGELAAAGDLALRGVDDGEPDVGRQAVGNALPASTAR
jgi:hypothetical protein